MFLSRSTLLPVFLLVSNFFYAQILSSDNAVVFVSGGGVLHCNGGILLSGSSDLTNQGDITTTKNSTLSGPGNFTIDGTSTVQGSGNYQIEQDWINNATFSAQSSTVYLYGSTEQFITSTNGTVTEFNILSLSGSGAGVNRRKTLQGVNSRISSGGRLLLNDRELYTMTNEMLVLNTVPTAVTNDQTFGSEGFVSSDVPGYLSWYTASASDYLFPVGSSMGVLRYRPVRISPFSASSNLFQVRMNNDLADNYGYPITQHDAGLTSLNPLYFHSIERPSGSSTADISIAFDASEDGEWITIGQWRPSNSMWNWLGDCTVSSLGGYSSVTRSAWNFDDPFHPYILAQPENQLIIPNVLTANNDGVNDLFYVTAKNLTDFHMTILNRWGETVFESSDIAVPWDGTSNGRQCVEGTYFYLIRAQSPSGEIVKHGHITLSTQ